VVKGTTEITSSRQRTYEELLDYIDAPTSTLGLTILTVKKVPGPKAMLRSPEKTLVQLGDDQHDGVLPRHGSPGRG
jgi:hypothetical protein